MKRSFLVLCGLALWFAVILGLAGYPVVPVRADGAFVVNSNADTNAADSFLTLREAMLVANGTLSGPFTDGEKTQLGGGCTWSGSTDNWSITGGCGTGFFDTITFSPSITQVVLGTPLPTLTDSGTFINGNSGEPRIDSASVNSDIFTIAGDHITISNLSIVNGYATTGYADIRINSGKDMRVAYNYLGMVPSAQDCAPAGVTRNSYYGVYVAPNSSGAAGANNAVAYVYGNHIGCHVDAGVYVFGADYVYVGVQPDGVTADGNSIGYILKSGVGYDIANEGDGVVFQASGADGVRYGKVSNNTIYNNHGNGIQLIGTGTNNSFSTYLNNIHNNSIGVNSLSGIRLTAGAFVNLIGTVGLPNLIERNNQDGITIVNSNSNSIDGNELGMLIPDSGNSRTGIFLDTANSNSLTSNMIVNNSWAGVWIKNGANNTLRSNSIGVNSSDTAVVANGMDGIALTDGAANNIVGTSDPAHPEYRNLIKFNINCGVRLRDGATSNTIDGNVIASNQEAGVCVFSNSNNNKIGTAFPGALQYIFGNTREGVYIESSSGNDIEQSISIGVATDNITPRGNGREGVLINGGTNTLVEPTLIAYNGLAGVAVVGATATGNRARPLEVRNNGGLPIDLGNDGFTPNGLRTPPGPNNWINYPVITSASGTPVTLNGTAPADCAILIYRAIGNPAAPGGGGLIIGSTAANGSGNWSATLPAGVGRNDVTLQTFIVSTGNTSEMSPRPVLYLPLIMR